MIFFIIDPFSIQINSHVGNNLLPGITILHHPDCFNFGTNSSEKIYTPMQKILRKDKIAKKFLNLSTEKIEPRNDLLSVVKINLVDFRY